MRVQGTLRAAACAGLASLLLAAVAHAATPPPNDAQATPTPVDATSSTITGTTDGATTVKTDPASPCDDTVTATVWYSITNVPDRDVVLRLTGQDGLEAVLAVYTVRKGRLVALECAETGDDGVATLGVTASNGNLVLVAQRTGSPAGAFTLQSLVPQAPERLPGRSLRGVAHGSVEEFLHESDLWHVDLRAGTTYRVSFVIPSGGECPSLRLYRPGGPPAAARLAFALRCNGADSFTPGLDGGGRYLLVVGIGDASGRVPYRLQVAPAQRDDTAPGVTLATGAWRDGRLDPVGTDQLDMYRFVVSERSDVTILLGKPWSTTVTLQLLRDIGDSVAAGHAIRRPLGPGTYYVIVHAPAGSAPVHYRLLLRERGVSRLTTPVPQNGTTPLGVPVPLSARIGKPAGHVAELEIDRFDPIDGWQYLRTYRLPIDAAAVATLTWSPPRVGWYRARIVTPSRSRYVVFQVTERAPGG